MVIEVAGNHDNRLFESGKPGEKYGSNQGFFRSLFRD